MWANMATARWPEVSSWPSISKNGKTNLNLDLKLLQKSTKSIRIVKQNDVIEIFNHDDSKSGPYFERILFVHLDLAVF